MKLIFKRKVCRAIKDYRGEKRRRRRRKEFHEKIKIKSCQSPLSGNFKIKIRKRRQVIISINFLLLLFTTQ